MTRTIGTERKAALVAVGTAAILGVATGAYAFGGSSSPRPTLAQARPAVAPATYPKRAARSSQGPVARAHQQAPSAFEGELSLDDGLVKLKVLRIVAGRPRQAWRLFEHRAVLDLSPHARIVDTRGGKISPAIVDDAIARVSGRLLPTSAWRWTDDELRPVIHAQRIVVLRLDRTFGD